MRVEEFLRDNARRFGDKVALVAGDARVTYRELDRASDRLAGALAEGGIARGDRLIVFMDNCREAVIAIFAALKAGAVFSPINPSTKAEKLAYVINNCGARALITQDKLCTVAGTALADAPLVALTIVIGGREPSLPGAVSFAAALAADVAPPANPSIDLDLAMLIYTSGSTGFPKGVMMTHQNVVAAATSITTYLENTPNDVILNVLPISFDYGLYQLLMAVKVGATLVLEQSFAFPQKIFAKMTAERVSALPLVPTMAAIILQMRDLQPNAFPHLRYITNTAAALPPAHIARLQTLFPTAGIAIPGTEAYVVDGQGVRVPPGVVGELVIRGAHVMKGYWNDPQATACALRPGPFEWEKVLHTGDLFRADADGFLYFVARKDDIIKTRGEKVSPKEVENALYALPGIREAAVVGVPDPVLGRALKAVVATDPQASLTAQDVIRHCARHLEDFMVPKLIEFRDALPKTESGKISRRLVAADTLEPAA